MKPDDDEEETQLLESIPAGSAMDKTLKDSLRAMSGQSGEPELQELISKTLKGETSLRHLMESSSFAAKMDSAAQRLRGELAELKPEELAQYREAAVKAARDQGLI